MERLKSKSLVVETKEAINKYIKTLDLSKENKLPSEENMAQMLGVSRITIRSALNELASEGVIFRRQGKGTFVNKEAVEMKATLTPVKKFIETIKNSGYEASTRYLGHEVINCDSKISKLLNIKESEKIVRVKKVFCADNIPCVYCIDVFPLSLLDGTEGYSNLDEYEISIFEYLRDVTNIKITWDRVEMNVVTTDEIIANPFDSEKNSKGILLLEGVNYDENDRAIMYIEEYIDTNYIKFNLIRQRIIE